MNTLASTFITSPLNKQEECAQFVIDNTSESFVMSGVVAATGQYTFSFWIRSDSDGQLLTCGTTVDTTTSWVKQKITFSAIESDIQLLFGTSGVYYIYRPILEAGNISSDWTPAPEDVTDSINKAQGTADTALSNSSVAQSAIQQIADSISTLVTDGNGTSLMTQTATGWTFRTSEIQSQIDSASQSLAELVEKMGSADAAIAVLSNSVDEFGIIAEYIHIGSYTYTDEDGTMQTEPSIDMFETDTGFKLKITNTRIVFTDGATELLTINSKTKLLTTPKAVVENELHLGKPLVGGRNLLYNTKSLAGSNITGNGTLAAESYNGFSVKQCNNSTGTAYVDFLQFMGIYPEKLGDVYTLSFYAKGSGEMLTYFYGMTGYLQVAEVVQSTGATSDYSDGASIWNLTNTWTKYWVTWTLKTSGDISVEKYVLFRAIAGSNVSVCGVKLEKGSNATTWTPAPEDAEFASMCGLWVWQPRSNGNLGLVWKGVSS